jgi:tetratricopeptide (TPR) repeat protein
MTILPMEAVNTCSALLEAGGLEPAALWLLRRTWKWFRRPDDTSGPAYDRFLLNYGRVALAGADEQGGETLQNFLRAASALPEALAYAGLYFAYAGDRAQALEFFGAASQRLEAASAATKADVALAIARYGCVYGDLDDVLKTIYWALPAVEADGDLPRRARLLAAAARILAAAGAIDEATKAIADSLPLAERIGDTVLVAELALARGLVHFDRQEYGEAREQLRGAADTFARLDRLPLYLDAALAWIEAAYSADDNDEAWEVYRSVESQLITAYAPRLYLVMGRYYAAYGQLDDARRNFERALEEAQRLDNEWIRNAVTTTLAQLRGQP